MSTRRRRSKISLKLAAIALLGALLMRPGFAAEAASSAHGDGKASPTGESNAARAPAGDRQGGGDGAAKPDAQGPRGDEGKAHDGAPPAGNETVKDANPSAPGGKDAGAVETNIAPSRYLDKKNRTGQGKSAIESAATRNLHRRTLSVPHPQNRPVRNAIGVPVEQHKDAERHDTTHPASPAVPHNAPAGAAAVPGAAGSHLTKVEGALDHHVPSANPVMTPLAANRGAINGTAVTHHNTGPPQIGGPKAASFGVNGTTIRPKH
jgi:hypothetical protein